jgi:16S rRNA pseudouridine516 synthase
VRRLDQLLANLGYCSRRECRAFLRSTEVLAGGERLLDPSVKVDATSIRVAGEPLDHPDGLLLLLHKPAGRVCSHDSTEGPSVFDLLPPRWRNRHPPVTTVGRLDKDTTGALLLTDLGEWVHRLTSPRHHVPKGYRVTVDRDLPPGLAERFASGALLLEGETHPCAPASFEQVGAREARLVLTEGRYHQVKRMFAACDMGVIGLHRETFGALGLDDLPPGEWRELPLSTFTPTVPQSSV